MTKLVQSPPASQWFLALTLEERLPGQFSTAVSAPSDLTQHRMEQWRSILSAKSDKEFLSRLGCKSNEHLNKVLAETESDLQQRIKQTPDWLAKLLNTLQSPQSSDFTYSSEMVHTEGLQPLISVVKPLLDPAVKQLAQRLAQPDLKQLPLTTDSLNLFIAGLPGQLLGMMARTIVLELHIARLTGTLSGNTPSERFQSFVQQLETPQGLIDLFEQYPVLARQLDLRVQNWLNFNLKFIDQLMADWPALLSLFFNNKPGKLTGLETEAGDLHAGGQSVRILKFDSGQQLVYKPRSLELDQNFQHLLQWINDQDSGLFFKTLKILNQGDHGWMEFVASDHCNHSDQIENYFHRLGGLLALLYAVQATDFHHENLIASGEHPVLVDLESLFQPWLRSPDAPQAGMMAAEMLGYSALRVGLLPRRIGSESNPNGTDFTGIGYNGGQQTPFEIPIWKRVATDEMHLGRSTVQLSPSHNLPRLTNVMVNADNYTTQISQGFQQLYTLLLQHKEDLLSTTGPISKFSGNRIRVILRPTRSYALLLQESFHPDLLRDGLDRDQHFDHLWQSIKHRPFLKQAISSEQQDLRNGDIPIFHSDTDSVHIYNSQHKIIGHNGIEKTGMHLVTERISQLSQSDLQRQLWLVNASLGTLKMSTADAGMPHYPFKLSTKVAEPEALLEASCQVGKRLSCIAMSGEHDASWLGLQLEFERYWTVVDLVHDLYSGLPGIVLFLAYLGKVSKQQQYTDLAHKGWRTLESQLESSKPYLSNIGGYEGWGGIIYTLTHLSHLWENPTILDLAESYAHFSQHLIEQDDLYDVLSGSAGYLAGILCLYQSRPTQKLVAIAKSCGHHLIRQASNTPHGIGWIHPSVGDRPLTGFSHGNAGIAWALAKLSTCSGEMAFAETAIQALNYERELYSDKHRNWPDLREHAKQQGGETIDPDRIYPASWCHGAVGIGLSRVAMLDDLDDPSLQQEISIAVETTCQKGFGHNHSLCHGDLGNLDLLLMAARRTSNPQLHQNTYQIAQTILDSIKDQGWLTGVPEGVETTGLMNGISGIGLQLLRLAAPDRVPSVLTLEPPKGWSK